MLEQSIYLESIDLKANRFRFHHFELSPGLFGPTLIRRWGRIGTLGQTRILLFEDEVGATTEFVRLVDLKQKNGYSVPIKNSKTKVRYDQPSPAKQKNPFPFQRELPFDLLPGASPSSARRGPVFTIPLAGKLNSTSPEGVYARLRWFGGKNKGNNLHLGASPSPTYPPFIGGSSPLNDLLFFPLESIIVFLNIKVKPEVNP